MVINRMSKLAITTLMLGKKVFYTGEAALKWAGKGDKAIKLFDNPTEAERLAYRLSKMPGAPRPYVVLYDNN